MLLSGFFTSVEFYVLMVVIAASIIALAARPQTRGEVMEYLLASRLSDELSSDIEAPSIEFRCIDASKVLLIRRGLTNIYMSGAVSAAVKFDGLNLNIEERLVEGSSWDSPAAEAEFTLDFLRPGRYHVTYNSQKTGLFVAFQLHVREGITATRILSR